MALDPAPLAKLAAEFIDDLLEDEDYGPDAEFVRIAVVVEVDAAGDGSDRNIVHTKGRDLTVDAGGMVGPTERAGLMVRALAAELADDD